MRKSAGMRGRKVVVHRHAPSKKKLALEKYRKAGIVGDACKAAGIGRRTWYDWIEKDPEFAALATEANDGVADDLEAEAIRRAKKGSDALLVLLLRARRPERYRETQKIEIVSPIVKENLRRTIEAVNDLLAPEDARRLLARLDLVWAAE